MNVVLFLFFNYFTMNVVYSLCITCLNMVFFLNYHFGFLL